MLIPFYPEFRPLELNDLERFKAAFSLQPPQISEFTFTNLYSWRSAYNLQICDCDGLLLCRSESAEGRRFFAPIGLGGHKAVIERVLADSGGVFFRVPEEIKALFVNEPRFSAEADPDSADYLYNVSDLTLFPGRKYDGKRNLVRRFQNEHNYQYLRIEESNAALCREFEDAWCIIRNCDGVEGLNSERQAVREMVQNFSSFGLSAGAVLSGGKICAIAMGQELNPDTLVIHVLKADPEMTGLYQVMLQEFLKYEAGRFRYVNMEQDLGIPGLRKSKLSYHPCAMIRKYTLKEVHSRRTGSGF